MKADSSKVLRSLAPSAVKEYHVYSLCRLEISGFKVDVGQLIKVRGFEYTGRRPLRIYHQQTLLVIGPSRCCVTLASFQVAECIIDAAMCQRLFACDFLLV